MICHVLQRRCQPTPTSIYICTRILVNVASVFGHISACLHLHPKSQRVWAQFGTWGNIARSLGAIRAVCRAWQTFSNVLALGIFKANPRVPNPLSRCTYVRFGETVFPARNFSVFLRTSQMTDSRQHAKSATIQPCRTAAAVHPGDNNLAFKNIITACAVVEGCSI